MAAPTRAQLRDRARVEADQDSADFPTEAHYNLFLDEARREVWGDLVLAGWPVNFSTQTIAASGAAQYQLASGAPVFSVVSVYRVEGQQITRLPRLDPERKAGLLSNTGGLTMCAYEALTDPAQGAVLRLYPQVAPGSVLVEYLPEIPGFTGDSDVWYGPVRSDQLLVLRAAWKGCRKEGRASDCERLRTEYGEVLQRVIDSASWFDQRNAPRIRDVLTVPQDPFDYQVARVEF